MRDEWEKSGSAVQLYRKLVDSGTGGGRNATSKSVKLQQMRSWLKVNREASARDFYQALAIMASSKDKRVGEVSEGTLKKSLNIMNGLDPHHGARLRPEDWDEEIDGPYEPGKAGKAAAVALMEPNPPAPVQGITTTKVTDSDAPPVPTGIIHKVHQEGPAETREADLGPKKAEQPSPPQQRSNRR